jgi:hypothetical protein
MCICDWFFVGLFGPFVPISCGQGRQRPSLDLFVAPGPNFWEKNDGPKLIGSDKFNEIYKISLATSQFFNG